MDVKMFNLSMIHSRNISVMANSVELDSICGGMDAAERGNSSLCNTKAPGVSVASPVCMFVTGVLGNILALVVLHTTRRDVRKTPYFILLLGLAWSDLFSQLMTTPVIISVYANNLQWRGGKPLCFYNAFVMIAFGIILPVLVCCLSIERLLALRFTYLYSRIVTVAKTKLVFVLCWIFVIIFSSGPLVGFGNYARQYPGTWCFLNFHNESHSDTAYAFTFALFNVAVIVVILVCNIAVVITLLKMRRSRRHNSSPSVDLRFVQPRKSLFQMEMEIQMVWFLCAVTVVFVTCWLPLNVHIVINLTTGKVNYSGDLTAIRLASINQILDPWLYILLRKSVLLKICGCLKRLLPSRRKGEGRHISGAGQNGLSQNQGKPSIPALDTQFLFDKAQCGKNDPAIPLVETHSGVYFTCERGTDGGLQMVHLKDSDSSDSDVFLDSNSSRCFPAVFDQNTRPSTSSYFSASRQYAYTTGNSSTRQTLRRMFSLPADFRT